MVVLGVPCDAAGALAGVLEIFWFRRLVESVRDVLPRGSCLLWGGGGGGSWIISSGFAGGLWVLVSPLMPWLCYWVLTGVLGSVLVLLISGCRGHFWIFCSEVLERFN